MLVWDARYFLVTGDGGGGWWNGSPIKLGIIINNNNIDCSSLQYSY